jgi:hypothetical protein
VNNRSIDSDLFVNTELEVGLDTNDSEMECDVNTSINTISGTDDYEKLKNLPHINGTELVGNYDELDPTVPDWAKENTKPSYTPNEINAVDVRDEISFTDIKEMWDSIFK